METAKSPNETPVIKSSTNNQLKVTLFSNLISLNTGLVTGWISPTIPQISPPNSPIGEVTTDETAWLASMLPLGAFFGAFLCAIISEKLGRKFSIILWAFPFMINSIMILTATNIYYLLIGRFLCGCGMAGCFLNISSYVGETVVPKIRGTMSSMFSIVYTIGITSGYAIGGFTNYKVTAWIMLGVAIANVVLCILFVPETPFILVKNGQIDKAAETLAWLRHLEVNDEEIQKELSRLKSAIENSPMNSLKVAKLLLMDKVSRRSFLLCISLFTIQILTGMYAVHSYAVSIFMEGGAAELTPPGAATLYGCIQVLGTISASKYIDKWGRKILMTVSSFGVSFGLLSLAVYFHLSKLEIDLTYFKWVPVLSLCFSVYIYSAGAVGTPFTYTSDVLTNEVRSFATMIIMQFLFLISFLLLRFFPILTVLYGYHVVFYFFGIITIFGGIFVIFNIPETKGKSIEEVLKIMEK